MKDYYKMLGLNSEAEAEEIKKAYKKKAIELHPDKNKGDKYYEAKFKEIQEAYSVLSNAELKYKYDEQYKSRIDFLINQAKNLNFLPEERFPDYIKGMYELEIREYNQELAKLYWDLKVVDELMYKSFALARFQTIGNHAPKFENFEDEIKYFREAATKSVIKVLKNPFRLTPGPQEDFYKVFMEYLLSKNNGKLTEGQFSLRCLFLPKELIDGEWRIISHEFMIIILHYSSFLEEKYRRNKEYRNKTTIAQVLREFTPLVYSRGVDAFKSGGIWPPILGAIPPGEGEAEKELMEFLQKDCSEDKIDNIKTITKIAERICETNDFSQDNMFGFSYVIKQLNIYSQNDENVKQSLKNLKDLYYDFAHKLYHSFDAKGRESEASALIRHLGEKILIDDNELRAKLNVLWLGTTAKSHSSSNEGCFIATAYYGDYDAPEVKKLRTFRDTVLKNTFFGRVTIKLYYWSSPFLVKMIIRNPKVKNVLKEDFLPILINRISS